MDNFGQLVKDGFKKVSEAAMDAVVTSIVANQEQHLSSLQDMQKWGIVKLIQRFTTYKYLHRHPCVVAVKEWSLLNLMDNRSSEAECHQNAGAAVTLGPHDMHRSAELSPQNPFVEQKRASLSSRLCSPIRAPAVGQLDVRVDFALLILLGNVLTFNDSLMQQYEWKVVVSCDRQQGETNSSFMTREDNLSKSCTSGSTAGSLPSTKHPLHSISWETHVELNAIKDLWADICIDLMWRRLPAEEKNLVSSGKGVSWSCTAADQFSSHTPSIIKTPDALTQTTSQNSEENTSEVQAPFAVQQTSRDLTSANAHISGLSVEVNPARRKPPSEDWQIYGQAMVPLSSLIVSQKHQASNFFFPMLQRHSDDSSGDENDSCGDDSLFWLHLFPHQGNELKYYRCFPGYPGLGMPNPQTTLGFIRVKILFSPSMSPQWASILSVFHAPSTRWVNAFSFEPQYLEAYALRARHLLTTYPRWVPKFLHLLSSTASSKRCLCAPLQWIPTCFFLAILSISFSYCWGFHEVSPTRLSLLYRNYFPRYVYEEAEARNMQCSHENPEFWPLQTSAGVDHLNDSTGNVGTGFTTVSYSKANGIAAPYCNYKTVEGKSSDRCRHTNAAIFQDPTSRINIIGVGGSYDYTSAPKCSPHYDTSPHSIVSTRIPNRSDLQLGQQCSADGTNKVNSREGSLSPHPSSKSPVSARSGRSLSWNPFKQTITGVGTKRLDEMAEMYGSTFLNEASLLIEKRHNKKFPSGLSGGLAGGQHTANPMAVIAFEKLNANEVSGRGKQAPTGQAKPKGQSVRSVSIVDSPFGPLGLTVHDPTSYCKCFPIFSDDAGDQDVQLLLEHGVEMLDGVQRITGVLSCVVEKIKFSLNWEDPLLSLVSCVVLFFACLQITIGLCLFSRLPYWVQRIMFLFPLFTFIVVTDPWIQLHFWNNVLGLDLPSLYYSLLSRVTLQRQRLGTTNQLKEASTKPGFLTPRSDGCDVQGHPPQSPQAFSHLSNVDHKSYESPMPTTSLMYEHRDQNADFATSRSPWAALNNRMKRLFNIKAIPAPRKEALLSSENHQALLGDKTKPLNSSSDVGSKVLELGVSRKRLQNITQPSQKAGGLLAERPLSVLSVSGRVVELFRNRPRRWNPLRKWGMIRWQAVQSCCCDIARRIIVCTPRPLCNIMRYVLLVFLHIVDINLRFFVHWWMRLPDRREIEHRQIAASQYVSSLSSLLPASADIRNRQRPRSPQFQNIRRQSSTQNGLSKPTERNLPDNTSDAAKNVEQYLSQYFQNVYSSRNPIANLMNIRLINKASPPPQSLQTKDLDFTSAKINPIPSEQITPAILSPEPQRSSKNTVCHKLLQNVDAARLVTVYPSGLTQLNYRVKNCRRHLTQSSRIKLSGSSDNASKQENLGEVDRCVPSRDADVAASSFTSHSTSVGAEEAKCVSVDLASTNDLRSPLPFISSPLLNSSSNEESDSKGKNDGSDNFSSQLPHKLPPPCISKNASASKMRLLFWPFPDIRAPTFFKHCQLDLVHDENEETRSQLSGELDSVDVFCPYSATSSEGDDKADAGFETQRLHVNSGSFLPVHNSYSNVQVIKGKVNEPLARCLSSSVAQFPETDVLQSCSTIILDSSQQHEGTSLMSCNFTDSDDKGNFLSSTHPAAPMSPRCDGALHEMRAFFDLVKTSIETEAFPSFVT